MYKIAIFTADDYTYLFNAWCEFVEKGKEKYQIAGIFVFPDVMKKKKGMASYLEYLKIIGPFDFLKLAVKSLWYRIKKENKKYKNFSDLAEKNNIPVFYKNNPNDSEVVQWVKDNNIDVALITFGYIIKLPLIEAVKAAILNKHSSLLPSFRGIWPVFWSLMDNNAQIGATIHIIDKEIDKGEIILQKSYGMLKSISVFDYYGTIYDDMSGLFLKALDYLRTGERERLENISANGYFSLPTREQYLKFKNKGLKFI